MEKQYIEFLKSIKQNLQNCHLYCMFNGDCCAMDCKGCNDSYIDPEQINTIIKKIDDFLNES